MILNAKQHRTLTFIAEANRGGAFPTGKQINEWRKNPARKPAKRGPLLRAAVPARPERRVPRTAQSAASALTGGGLTELAARLQRQQLDAVKPLLDMQRKHAEMMAPLLNLQRGVAQQHARTFAQGFVAAQAAYDVIPAVPGKPAEYGPDTPREGFVAHLRRLGWIERVKPRGYRVTELGHALLRVHQTEPEGEQPTLLAGRDRAYDYSTVIGGIAECGVSMLIDPYLGLDELRDLLEHTEVRRFLIGTKLPEGRRASLGVMLRTWKADRGDTLREMRMLPVHDRWIVGEGALFTMGVSLNGLGKSPSHFIQMPESAASALRPVCEVQWGSAEVIVPADPSE